MRTDHNNNTHAISRSTILLCLLWFITCVVSFSNAGSNTLFVIMVLYTAVTWGVIWLIRLGVSFRIQQQRAYEKPPLLYLLFEPLVVIVPLTLAYFGIFSYVRFALSEQALLNYVEEVREGKVNLTTEFNYPSRQVGLYTVSFTDLMPDGTVRVITSLHGVMDRAGFANSKQNPPPRQGEDSYKHIHQQWWYWH
jgi:Ca2+/Na+ antiporter